MLAIEKLEKRRSQLLDEARAAEITVKEEQTAGDAIYWPLFNLDRKNPRANEDIAHLPPEELVASILQKEERIAQVMINIRKLLAKEDA